MHVDIVEGRSLPQGRSSGPKTPPITTPGQHDAGQADNSKVTRMLSAGTGTNTRRGRRAQVAVHAYGDAQPPATSTHSARQLPCLPSTSTMSVSHRHRHPTPFSLTGSGFAQYSSSSIRFFSSCVVISRYGIRGNCRAGALAGQC